jgi:hypothetical protein
MAALHMWPADRAGGMDMAGGGATAESFLLPLLIGISVLAFLMTATIALSPSGEELRADAELMQRIEAARAGGYPAPTVPSPQTKLRTNPVVSRAAQARRQAARRDQQR